MARDVSGMDHSFTEETARSKSTRSWMPVPGRWAAFEVKLGQGRIDEAAAALIGFANRVDTARNGQPAALAMIIGSGYGYQRPDGVGMIPVGVLGP